MIEPSEREISVAGLDFEELNDFGTDGIDFPRTISPGGGGSSFGERRDTADTAVEPAEREISVAGLDFEEPAGRRRRAEGDNFPRPSTDSNPLDDNPVNLEQRPPRPSSTAASSDASPRRRL